MWEQAEQTSWGENRAGKRTRKKERGRTNRQKLGEKLSNFATRGAAKCQTISHCKTAEGIPGKDENSPQPSPPGFAPSRHMSPTHPQASLGPHATLPGNFQGLTNYFQGLISSITCRTVWFPPAGFAKQPWVSFLLPDGTPGAITSS